jgi:hypothetical protein
VADAPNDRVLSPADFGRALKDFLDASLEQSEPEIPKLVQRLREHLGTDDLSALPILSRDFARTDLPNIQVALDHLFAGGDWSLEIVGLHSQHGAMAGYSLAELASPPGGPRVFFGVSISEAAAEHTRIRLDAETEIECVVNAVQLIRHGEHRLAVLVGRRERMMGADGVRLEVMAADREQAEDLVADVARLMAEHNVYRGRVLSFAHNQEGGVEVEIRTLPNISRDAIVLPDGVLERVERQALGPVRHRERLLAAGRHLKRGLLLHGPPGTGKTMTAMYLSAQMPGRTVIILSGDSFGLIGPACSMARQLEPSMVVMEDVDLVAHARDYENDGPLLFELLNEMDGLAEDADVLFMLTTNRPDILEPALAARPGRIDEAVELPLPDSDGQRRLIELYARGLTLDVDDLEPVLSRLEGASPAHIKELLRKAALISADRHPDGEIVVDASDLDAALDTLVISSGEVRASLFANPPSAAAFPFPGEMTLGED